MSDTDTHLTTGELAKRWKMKEATLRNWRYRGTGPRYLKPSGVRGKALYKLSDVLAWEAKNTIEGDAT